MRDQDSYIYRQGMTPNTRVAVSGKNRLYSYSSADIATWSQLGVTSDFSPSDSRDATEVRGIGFGDQIAELVPGFSGPITISVSKTLLYLLDMHQMFGYKGGIDGMVRALKHHKWPFDIRSELVFTELKELTDTQGATEESTFKDGQALITIYEACWMTSYGTNRSSDDTIISEDIDISVTDISDGLTTVADYGPKAQTGNEARSIRFKK